MRILTPEMTAKKTLEFVAGDIGREEVSSWASAQLSADDGGEVEIIPRAARQDIFRLLTLLTYADLLDLEREYTYPMFDFEEGLRHFIAAVSYLDESLSQEE